MGTIPAIILQSVISYCALLIIARLMGSKQLGQLTFFHYVVGITVGSIAAVGSLGTRIAMWEGVASMTAWASLAWATSWLSLKSQKVRGLLDGKPMVVVRNGKVMEESLQHSRLNLDDLISMLREKGSFRMADVEFAILETTGGLSVLRKSQAQPVTPADLDMPTNYMGLAIKLVVDGKVEQEGLKMTGLTEEWLQQELRKRGIAHVSAVAYAELDSRGNLYIDLRRDHLKTR